MAAYRRYSQLDSLVSLSKGELLANHLINKGKLTYKQLEDIREAFVLFDKNRDGTITTDEVSDVCQSLNLRLSSDQLNEMIRLVDNDGNGQIDFEEFVRMMAKRFAEEKWERDLQRAFQVFDKDGDGYIDISELKRTMFNIGERLTDAEVEDMMREADKNGDGKVDYEEFSRVLSSAAPT